jgi:hypothetical protein
MTPDELRQLAEQAIRARRIAVAYAVIASFSIGVLVGRLL